MKNLIITSDIVITRLNQIVDEARKRGPVKLAVAFGQDIHSIQAVDAAVKEGIAIPTIYGDKNIIE